jgi:hypothetical protein
MEMFLLMGLIGSLLIIIKMMEVFVTRLEKMSCCKEFDLLVTQLKIG